MKARDAMAQLKHFEATERVRKVADLEHMVAEFEQMALDLGRQIQAEEERTGIKDRSHFAYSTFARSAGQRRENLLSSVRDLRAKLELAVAERDELLAEISETDVLQRAHGDDAGRQHQTAPAVAR